MFPILVALIQLILILGVEGADYHSRIKDACEVYEDAVPKLFDDILILFRDAIYYAFVKWPEIPGARIDYGRNVDGNTLAKGSLELEKSILKLQDLVVKDVGHVLDEIADKINLTYLLKKARDAGFKVHLF